MEAATPIIDAFRREHERLQTIPPETELGTSTVSVTMISGGTGSNVIPAECRITVGQRTIPGQNAHDEYHHLVELAEAASPLPITHESLIPPLPDGTCGADAFYQPPDGALALRFATASGNAPKVAPFGTNALRYHGVARELVVFGPGSIDDAHMATERVAIDDLVRLAEIYTDWLEPT
ncbi:MAG: peptidase dimerization domain-containing protein [Ilumatobacteraceae bacterium]